jgi:hypothetical protein
VGGRTEVKLLASKVMWLEVLESTTQSVIARGVKTMVLKELAID